MHGLKQFVCSRESASDWETIAKTAGTSGWYTSTSTYPDAELAALLRVTAARWGQSVASVTEEFGASLVPTLFALYGSFVDRRWRTLDLLENVEAVIHRTVRLRNPDASPPELRPRRISPVEVRIDYSSARRLCALATGICRGVAARYGDTITVEQDFCMERGDAGCTIVVKLTGAGS